MNLPNRRSAVEPAVNADIRRQDFAHFTAMRRGSDLLRDRIHIARGTAIKLPPIVKPKLAAEEPDLPTWRPPVSITSWREVVDHVARFSNVQADAILSASRKASHVRARSLVMLALHLRGAPYSLIGRWIGDRDHSTVIHAIDRIRERADQSELEMVVSLLRKDDAHAPA